MPRKIFGFITFLILFYLVLVNNQLVNSYNITTYNESETDLQIFHTLCYGDGTLAIYAVKPINETCLEPNFRTRIIYPNGTTEFNTRTYPIPEFNFCKTLIGSSFPMKVFRLLPKYAVIFYRNSTDRNSSADYGILLSKNGEYIR